jgi:hypothetical protein
VKASGTEGKPITFMAMPRRSATVGGFDLEGSYVRVEGFEITADPPATAVQLHASHCEILDNYIRDMMVAVSGTSGRPSGDGNTRDYSAVAHNRVAYNKVYHSEYGFMLGGEDWLVENNEVSRLFMYAGGNQNDDCDYSRFFGKGCVQRYYKRRCLIDIKVAQGTDGFIRPTGHLVQHPSLQVLRAGVIMMGGFFIANPPPNPLLRIEFGMIGRMVMQMKPPLAGREERPHPGAFVPGRVVHPQIHNLALKALHQLLQLCQKCFGVAVLGFHHAVFAGQRVDPAE